MNEIKILDENVSNIIAAGEVVESPSALVKELLENSIDANSTSILIEISNNARDIRIKDNGKGMIGDDLLLSIERHATSKIRNKDDLFNLSTYGFRGEALSSICAVAKVKITSKKDGELGNTITVLSSKVTSFKEALCDRGTDIEVKELFFNTPARLKFLRKNTTEYSYIKDIVFQEALANPSIAISLLIDKKEVLHTSGNGIENAIMEVFGRNTLKNLIPFSMGFLGNSNLSRSTKDSIYIFVNGRVVKSKIIEEAVIDGYYTKLSKGKYPFALIFVQVDGHSVDINVHPSKKIVKFSNDLNIYSKVNSEIKIAMFGQDTLTSQDVSLEATTLEPNSKDPVIPPFEKVQTLGSISRLGQQQRMVLEIAANDLSDSTSDKFTTDNSTTSNFNTSNSNFNTNNSTKDSTRDSYCISKDVSISDSITNDSITNDSISNNSTTMDFTTSDPNSNSTTKDFNTSNFTSNCDEVAGKVTGYFRKNSLKVLGQFLNTYIIVENNETLEFYDQHIVHERILYEEYKNEYMSKSIQSQTLLIPQRISFEPREMSKILENKDVLESFGFQIEEFDKNEILLRAVPHFQFKESMENIIRDILSEITEYKTQDPRESVIITMSCKGAIKAGEICSIEELELLVNKLHEIGEYTCPHGRPIILKLNKDEIEKKFKRK